MPNNAIVTPINTVEPRSSVHVGHEHRPGFNSCQVSLKNKFNRSMYPFHQRKAKAAATTAPQIKIVIKLLFTKKPMYQTAIANAITPSPPARLRFATPRRASLA